ncbi:MAG: hypothetical protein UH084_00265 [Paludibacteraceae bacterium]|nr:hypothetical protein [Paludibacteraceae bacterium]
MVPLCYRTATVNGLKNPACIRHASYCDVQDANEMRTVENAKRNERHTGRIRDDSCFKKKTPPLGMGGGGELIEKKNKIALIVFNYSVTRVKL